MINVPLAKDRTVGPSQELVFLGIHLSTINMMAKLPDDKLQCYNEKLENLLHVRTVKLSTMQSVIGCLQFATNVVLPGKAFVRRLIDTFVGISKPFHYVTITAEARADIRMWHLFFKFHNGKTLFLSTKKGKFFDPKHVFWCQYNGMCSHIQQWLVCHRIPKRVAEEKHCFPWILSYYCSNSNLWNQNG